MKIFLDTADREMIKKWLPTGIINGVTTNPSLISNELLRNEVRSDSSLGDKLPGKQEVNIKEALLEICSMVPGDVSIEVVKKDPKEVYNQAKEIAALADNVVVKIPFAFEYLPVIDKLVKEDISVNVTLVFSLLQALLVAKLGVKYISPFIGRWDDIDVDGIELVEKMVHMVEDYGFVSQVLAASIRHVMHWHSVVLAGADVVTVPPKLLDVVMNHPLTKKGIERFDEDWQKLGKAELLN